MAKELSANTGIGVDIADISRFVKLDQKKDKLFLKRVYTSAEIDYCFSKAKPAQHLAARFAGKEAIIKGLRGLGFSVFFKQIEITNQSSGIPKVRLTGVWFSGKVEVLLSLSHCEDKAIAFAVVYRH